MPQPVPVAGQQRLIKAELGPEFLQQLLGQGRTGLPPAPGLGAGADSELGQKLFDRPARNKLAQGKDNEGDAQKGRHDQQDTLDEVVEPFHDDAGAR